MARPSTTTPFHPGDAALLRATQALARSGGTRLQGEAVETLQVLAETVADAGWQAHGTPGIVALMGAVACGAYTDDTWKGWEEVHRLIEQTTVFCKARGLTGAKRRQGLGAGLAKAVAWAKAEGGDGEALVGAVFGPITGEALRSGLEEALAVAGSGEDRLTLARAGLGEMQRLLPTRDEAAWRPRPASVAWLAGGLASTCRSDNALRILSSACGIRAGEDGGTLLERLLALFAREVAGWDGRAAGEFKREWARARRVAVRQARAAVVGTASVLDSEDIEHMHDVLYGALAMQQAASALARFDGAAQRRPRLRG